MSDRDNATLGPNPLATTLSDQPEFEIEQFIDDRRDLTTFFAHYRSLLLQSQFVAPSPTTVNASTSQTPESLGLFLSSDDSGLGTSRVDRVLVSNTILNATMCQAMRGYYL